MKIDRDFAEKFLTCIEDYDSYGVHLLFNEWWAGAPEDAMKVYCQTILNHPEQGPLAREGFLADPITLSDLDAFGSGTLGEAYRQFIVDNGLEENLGAGYRALHDEIERSGKLTRMPDVIRYKVLRGFQTHDFHHILTGYPPTPYGELSLQAFGFAQQNYPYAGMWISVITAHVTLLRPGMIDDVMTSITDGWRLGKAAESIQFVKFEHMLDQQVDELRARFGFAKPPT